MERLRVSPVTVRCSGCGDTRHDCGRWMLGAAHRCLGVICGKFEEVCGDCDKGIVAPGDRRCAECESIDPLVHDNPDGPCPEPETCPACSDEVSRTGSTAAEKGGARS